jgi:CNT family concentrative nucleoside transporter
MDFLRALIGLIGLLGIAVLFSENRRKIDWKLVLGGVTFQIILALLFLVVPGADKGFDALATGFVWITDFSKEGAGFVFGKLTDQKAMEALFGKENGFIFAFMVLPTIIFFSALC